MIVNTHKGSVLIEKNEVVHGANTNDEIVHIHIGKYKKTNGR
jgi:hypothetical protein